MHSVVGNRSCYMKVCYTPEGSTKYLLIKVCAMFRYN